MMFNHLATPLIYLGSPSPTLGTTALQHEDTKIYVMQGLSYLMFYDNGANYYAILEISKTKSKRKIEAVSEQTILKLLKSSGHKRKTQGNVTPPLRTKCTSTVKESGNGQILFSNHFFLCMALTLTL